MSNKKVSIVLRAMDIRTTILHRCKELFFARGIRSVTMNDIARNLGMSKKTIYQYFKDKAELVHQVTMNHIEGHHLEMEQFTAKASNAIEELFFLSQYIRNNVLSINPIILYDLQTYYAKAWGNYVAFKDKYMFAYFYQLLERGKNEGHFRAQINSKILAKLRIEQIQLCLNPNVFPGHEYEFAEVKMQLLEHYICGIITSKGSELFNEFKIKLNE